METLKYLREIFGGEKAVLLKILHIIIMSLDRKVKHGHN